VRRLAGSSEQQTLSFVREAVEAGASVYTDGSAAYRSLSAHGYRHRQSVRLGAKAPAHNLYARR
jgi:transposase-like protein